MQIAITLSWTGVDTTADIEPVAESQFDKVVIEKFEAPNLSPQTAEAFTTLLSTNLGILLAMIDWTLPIPELGPVLSPLLEKSWAEAEAAVSELTASSRLVAEAVSGIPGLPGVRGLVLRQRSAQRSRPPGGLLVVGNA
jgi:hypothetical protein